METIKASKVISNADGTTVSTTPDTDSKWKCFPMAYLFIGIIILFIIGFMIGRKMGKK